MKHDRALVIGAGIGGLIAASILARHFREVIVIDRDTNIGEDQPRTGAAQGKHLHVLLARGQEILFQRFPEIEQALLTRNCPRIDWARDTVWTSRSGRFPNYLSGVSTISMSRPLLESLLYKEVAKLYNVAFEQKSFSQSVHSDFDLCVNSSGYSRDAEYRSHPLGLIYRSAIFKADEVKLSSGKQFYYQADPIKERIGGVLTPVEDGKVIATIIEYGGNLKPKDRTKKGFLAKAAAIPDKTFHDAIQNANLLTEISLYSKPVTRIAKKINLSENAILFADALVSLNPALGQGMSLAILQGRLLDELLSKKDFSPNSFHDKALRLCSLPYRFSLASSGANRASSVFLGASLKLCRRSTFFHRRFLYTLHMKGK